MLGSKASYRATQLRLGARSVPGRCLRYACLDMETCDMLLPDASGPLAAVYGPGHPVGYDIVTALFSFREILRYYNSRTFKLVIGRNKSEFLQ